MALPTVVAVGTAAAGAGDITPGLPSGWAQNDIFLAVLEYGGADVVTVPSGWAHVADSPSVQANTQLAVLWKRAGSSESAPTFTDAGNHQIGRIIAIRGCPTSGDPWDVTAANISGTATAVSIPGDTTTVADCLVVAAVASGADVLSTAEVSGWTNVSLANLTECADDFTDAGNGGGIGVATGEKAAAGAYSATTATLVTTGFQARLSIALKPAGAGTVHSGAAALSGESSLQGSAVRQALGAAALAGDGALLAAGVRQALGAAALSGDGALSASGVRVQSAQAALSADGALTAQASAILAAAAALSGGGVLSAAGVRLASGAAALSGQSVFTASGVLVEDIEFVEPLGGLSGSREAHSGVTVTEGVGGTRQAI